MNINQIKTFEELREQASRLGFLLSPGDPAVLRSPLTIEKTTIPNRLAIQPVEGADGEADGTPGEHAVRRYLRYAEGGSGLIWMEAVALLPELKSNPHQFVLTGQNLDRFKKLIEEMKETGIKRNGYAPTVVIQMSHPGRSCYPRPIPAVDNPGRDKMRPSKGQKAPSDNEIEAMAALYADMTKLAREAGFDGVDVKACHQFFISELLSAFERKGRYGGSYENRTRHFKEALAASRAESGGMFLTTRINFYDGMPYPLGWGMKRDGSFDPDGSEPLRLIREIGEEFGVELVNCSSGNPDFEEFPLAKSDDPLFSPPVSPFKGAARMHRYAGEMKGAMPKMNVLATSFSDFRQFAPSVGARLLEKGAADLIGFGREALAYPDFARDILQSGGMDTAKCCVGCGLCNKLMGAFEPVGCPVRDEMYKSRSM